MVQTLWQSFLKNGALMVLVAVWRIKKEILREKLIHLYACATVVQYCKRHDTHIVEDCFDAAHNFVEFCFSS